MKWEREKAIDEGASVIVVEANYAVGGHAILSDGNGPLGGGTSSQRKYGIEDSPHIVFADLTDWSIVQPNGWPDYRYNIDYDPTKYNFLNAAAINNPHQAKPMDGATLHATVERYNAFADSETDVDFGRPTPQYTIRTPPFYAAWATPLVHDTRAGLRINAQSQVMDMHGQVIPGLSCGGESAGGFNQHGLGRCTAQGYIAGKNAAAERPQA